MTRWNWLFTKLTVYKIAQICAILLYLMFRGSTVCTPALPASYNMPYVTHRYVMSLKFWNATLSFLRLNKHFSTEIILVTNAHRMNLSPVFFKRKRFTSTWMTITFTLKLHAKQLNVLFLRNDWLFFSHPMFISRQQEYCSLEIILTACDNLWNLCTRRP